MAKFKPSERSSVKLERGSVTDEKNTSNFKISLAYFDPEQPYASSFHHWQSVGLLSRAMETLQGFCKRPLRQQIDGDKFAVYQSFPPANKTKFEYPRHVPEDAEWARIHVNGPAVLVGHIVGDTFYLVFLDKTHKFWLTKRVTGK